MRGSAKNGPVVSSSQITQALQCIKPGKENARPNKVVELAVQETPVNLKPLRNQIRKFFEWQILDDGSCKSRELTGQGDHSTNHVFELCSPPAKRK